MSILKDLLAMGFSPISSICISAVGVLWWRMVWSERKNVKVREDWHAATLARVEEVERKSEECYIDREKLREDSAITATKLATVEERLAQFGRCPKQGCPMRRS